MINIITITSICTTGNKPVGLGDPWRNDYERIFLIIFYFGCIHTAAPLGGLPHIL